MIKDKLFIPKEYLSSKIVGKNFRLKNVPSGIDVIPIGTEFTQNTCKCDKISNIFGEDRLKMWAEFLKAATKYVSFNASEIMIEELGSMCEEGIIFSIDDGIEIK